MPINTAAWELTPPPQPDMTAQFDDGGFVDQLFASYQTADVGSFTRYGPGPNPDTDPRSKTVEKLYERRNRNRRAPNRFTPSDY